MRWGPGVDEWWGLAGGGLSQLSHPNIVEFQDVIETPHKIFVVMELVRGA